MDKYTKIFQINTQLEILSGIEKVMMDIHHALSETYQCKIVGCLNYKSVHEGHHIEENEYLKWNSPFMFRNSIVIVHQRKLLPILWLLNVFFFQNIKIVYIHHSILYEHKFLTIMPDHIVAIADKGIENLRDYFGVPENHIIKIHNCVADKGIYYNSLRDDEKITVLYPARVDSNKRQVEIVKHLKIGLNAKIRILFAGDGPCLNELREVVDGDPRFVVLGYCNDIIKKFQQCQYVMLFSEKEGLPITLIEAAMTGKPIICNNVGGNSEIVEDEEMGYVLDQEDWGRLLSVLNNLPDISENKYKEMSQKCRKKYEHDFTFEIFKKRYLDFISKL